MDSTPYRLGRQVGHRHPRSLGARERTVSALDLLLRRANVSGDFAAAVRLYANAAFERSSDQDRKLRDAVVRWFACDKVPELREHGILAAITNANAKQILRSALALLRTFGYGGMAIFIDEAEAIQDYSKAQRRAPIRTCASFSTTLMVVPAETP